MRELMRDALRGHDADYIEIRIKESRSTHLRYIGRKLEEIGVNSVRGSNVRAVVKGGWGFVCFNDLSHIRDMVSQAVHQARIVGSEATWIPGFLKTPPLYCGGVSVAAAD